MMSVYSLNGRAVVVLVGILTFLGLSLFATGFVAGLLVGRSEAQPRPAVPQPLAEQPIEKEEGAGEERKQEAEDGGEKAAGPKTSGKDAQAASGNASLWALQAGVFLSRNEAGGMAERMAGLGQDSVIMLSENGSGDALYMVRFGGYGSAVDALAAAEKFNAEHGLNVSVAAFVPKGAAKAGETKSVWLARTAAFLTLPRAWKLSNDLAAKGYKPCIVRLHDSRKKQWFVVVAASFPEKPKAMAFVKEYKAKEKRDCYAWPMDVQRFKALTVSAG